MMYFLGMSNFCTVWIPGYSILTAPLVHALHGNPMAPQDAFKWSEETEMAFTDLKQVLSSSSVLALTEYDKPFSNRQ